MVLFINQTGTIGTIFNSSVNNLTGSPFMTLILLFVLIIAFFMIFRLPFELTAIFILPLGLIYMSFFSEFVAVGLVLLLYVGLILAKNFPIN